MTEEGAGRGADALSVLVKAESLNVTAAGFAIGLGAHAAVIPRGAIRPGWMWLGVGRTGATCRCWRDVYNMCTVANDSGRRTPHLDQGDGQALA